MLGRWVENRLKQTKTQDGAEQLLEELLSDDGPLPWTASRYASPESIMMAGGFDMLPLYTKAEWEADKAAQQAKQEAE